MPEKRLRMAEVCTSAAADLRALGNERLADFLLEQRDMHMRKVRMSACAEHVRDVANCKLRTCALLVLAGLLVPCSIPSSLAGLAVPSFGPFREGSMSSTEVVSTPS